MNLTAAALAAIIAACPPHRHDPPQHYVDRAIEMLEQGVVTVELRQVPAKRVNQECVNESGLDEPRGFPGRRFAACNILNLATMHSVMIVPEGECFEIKHETGHVAGWPWDHPGMGE